MECPRLVQHGKIRRIDGNVRQHTIQNARHGTEKSFGHPSGATDMGTASNDESVAFRY